MTIASQYNHKSGNLISPALFSFFKIALSIQGLLYFHTSFKIFFFFCGSSMKNAIGDLIGLALML